MPTVTKDDCKNTHEKLDKEVEKAIGLATASVEVRIKVWILMSVIAILGAFVYFLLELGSYRERVDNDNRRIEVLEQETRHRRGDAGRLP